jgi:hypothetical protein
LVVDRVSDGSTGDGSDNGANQGAGGAVSAPAVVSYDGSGEGARGAARDGALLSVRTRPDASAEDGAQGERCCFVSGLHGKYAY